MTNARRLLTTTALLACAAPIAAQTTTETPPAAPQSAAPQSAAPAADGALPTAPPSAEVAPPVGTGVVLVPVKALGEVTTTARQRREDLQGVPAAVSSFDADLPAFRSAGTLLPLLDRVPNTLASPAIGIGAMNSIYIRGLGSTEPGATIDPSVGTFVDGVYLRHNASAVGLFDIARVDVLRGSQGVLYGRNTSGGAVDVTFARPGSEFGGQIEGGYGSYRRGLVRGSVDVPVEGGGIAVKLSGYYDDDRGYVRNSTTGQRANDRDVAGLRAAVQFRLGERITWNVAAAYMRDDSDNLLDFDCDPADRDRCGGRFASTGVRRGGAPAASVTAFEAAGVTGGKARRGLGQSTDTQLYTSHFDVALGDATVSLITGFVEVGQDYAIDLLDGRVAPTAAVPLPPVTGFPAGGLSVVADTSNRQFSQEVRIAGTLLDGRLDYVAGGVYFDEDGRSDIAEVTTAASGATSLRADRTLRDATEAKAGYVQFGFSVTPALKVTGGVRYTDEDRTLRAADNRGFCNASALPAACVAGDARVASEIWTPHGAASFEVADDVTLFASASRGYRAGGFNLRALSGTPAPYATERVWTYQGGARTQFFGDRLRVNVTGFYLDGDDVQAVAAFTGTSATADLRSYGAELEVAAVPLTGLSLYANLGYEDAEYRGRGLSGIDPVYTPKFTAAGGASYDFAIPAAGIILQPSVDATYRTRYETGIANLTFGEFRGSESKAHVLIGAALAVKTDDGNWTLGVECLNCLDEEFVEQSFGGTSYLGSPRSWLVRARRVF